MNYAVAYEAALEKLRHSTIEEIEAFSGYPVEGNQIKVEFLGHKFKVEYPSGHFSPEPAFEGELPVFARILVLHYLVNRSQALQTGQLISYKELPGGNIYIQPFTNRAIRPLVNTFGKNPENLSKIASLLGGESVKLGDAGVVLKVFPKIPVTVVLWGADEELPASGNILFDRSASTILHTEDYAVLASFVAQTLKKLAEV
jgi:hypothetical protein